MRTEMLAVLLERRYPRELLRQVQHTELLLTATGAVKRLYRDASGALLDDEVAKLLRRVSRHTVARVQAHPHHALM